MSIWIVTSFGLQWRCYNKHSSTYLSFSDHICAFLMCIYIYIVLFLIGREVFLDVLYPASLQLWCKYSLHGQCQGTIVAPTSLQSSSPKTAPGYHELSSSIFILKFGCQRKRRQGKGREGCPVDDYCFCISCITTMDKLIYHHSNPNVVLVKF